MPRRKKMNGERGAEAVVAVKPLLCPWCGGGVDVFWASWRWVVGCYKPSCPVGPYASVTYDTEEEAVAAWRRLLRTS